MCSCEHASQRCEAHTCSSLTCVIAHSTAPAPSRAGAQSVHHQIFHPAVSTTRDSQACEPTHDYQSLLRNTVAPSLTAQEAQKQQIFPFSPSSIAPENPHHAPSHTCCLHVFWHGSPSVVNGIYSPPWLFIASTFLHQHPLMLPSRAAVHNRKDISLWCADLLLSTKSAW